MALALLDVSDLCLSNSTIEAIVANVFDCILLFNCLFAGSYFYSRYKHSTFMPSSPTEGFFHSSSYIGQKLQVLRNKPSINYMPDYSGNAPSIISHPLFCVCFIKIHNGCHRESLHLEMLFFLAFLLILFSNIILVGELLFGDSRWINDLKVLNDCSILWRIDLGMSEHLRVSCLPELAM